MTGSAVHRCAICFLAHRADEREELGTLSGRGVVELRPSARYLTEEWAPSVLRLEAAAVEDSLDVDAFGRPGWAEDLARRATLLRSLAPARDLDDYPLFADLRDLAGATLRAAYSETPAGARLTLADFDVWPADVGRDHLAGERE